MSLRDQFALCIMTSITSDLVRQTGLGLHDRRDLTDNLKEAAHVAAEAADALLEELCPA